jgi:hypothetical protein
MTNANGLVRDMLNILHRPLPQSHTAIMAQQKELVALQARLVGEAPDAISEFAIACIHELPGDNNWVTNIVKWMLSFLPERHWPALVKMAVEALLANPANEPASMVIDRAGYQSPQATHPWLESLFAINGRWGGAFWGSPIFHEARWEDVAFLVRDFDTLTSETQKRAAEALLQTRLPAAFEFIREHGRSYLSYLKEVGFIETPTGFRQLYPEQPLHLAFPGGYMTRLIEGKLSLYSPHPTWIEPESGATTHRFGGASGRTCGVCGQPSHNLLTLDPVRQGIGVTGLTRLEIATCLSCLGWERERLSYEHDANGSPRGLDSADPRVIPQFQMVPLQETRVGLANLGPRWKWQAWDEEQNLHRLGWHPVWVQPVEYVGYIECPRCGIASTFLLQLASPLPPGEGAGYGEFLWGMGGICYVFWCDACKISTQFWLTT